MCKLCLRKSVLDSVCICSKESLFRERECMCVRENVCVCEREKAYECVCEWERV